MLRCAEKKEKAQVSTYRTAALVYLYTISESPRPGREHPGLSSRVLKLPVFCSRFKANASNMLLKEVSQIYNYEVNIEEIFCNANALQKNIME